MLSILFTLVEENDRDKLTRLYHAYHKMMLRLARSKLKSVRHANYVADAEDVVQNAWCRIVKHVDKIDLSKHERVIRSYILTIVSNETARFLRAQEECHPLEEGIADEDFLQRLHVKERYRAVVGAIGRLDERYRNALYLHYVMEHPVKEIAAMLDVPEKTVYTRIERGKKKLLELLGKEGIT